MRVWRAQRPIARVARPQKTPVRPPARPMKTQPRPGGGRLENTSPLVPAAQGCWPRCPGGPRSAVFAGTARSHRCPTSLQSALAPLPLRTPRAMVSRLGNGVEAHVLTRPRAPPFSQVHHVQPPHCPPRAVEPGHVRGVHQRSCAGQWLSQRLVRHAQSRTRAGQPSRRSSRTGMLTGCSTVGQDRAGSWCGPLSAHPSRCRPRQPARTGSIPAPPKVHSLSINKTRSP